MSLKQRLGQAEAAVNKMRSSQAADAKLRAKQAADAKLQAEASAMVKMFPMVKVGKDYPGYDIAQHTFSANLPKDGVIKHCLSDCVNRGCGCSAVAISSDFRNCWLKTESGITRQSPKNASHITTYIKPSRRVRRGFRTVTQFC